MAAIITGASAGIGSSIAERLAEDGMDISILDVADPERTLARLKKAGTPAIGILGDVSSEQDVDAAVKATARSFGRIDVLVNCAAMTSLPKPFEDIGAADWRRMMEVNTLGPYLCSRAVVPHMRKARRGRIINIASTTFHWGFANLLHYVSSKGALVAFTRALARELGKDGITVNAIAPGLTMTERIARQTSRVAAYHQDAMRLLSIPRAQLPEDVNGLASFLASDDSAFITGQTIVVDGGLVMA